jgi:hypothetical protein
MSEALALAWADIRRRNRGLPKPAIAVTPGQSGSRCGSVGWLSDAVLLVDTATLDNPPLEVFGWLAHQAAHALADTRRKPTQASEGRYHDKAYRDAATELGLDVAVHGTLGWSETNVTGELAGMYSSTIERLTLALTEWEPPVPPARAAQAARPRNHNQVAARCSCDPPRRVQVTASTFDLGPIRCDVCGQPFAAPA